jgi:hypothetical protein
MGWLSAGSIGKGPLRVILEIAAIWSDKVQIKSLDSFVINFRKVLI